MNSLISSKVSGLRLLLVSAGVLLVSSAPAAQPTFDPQQQARDIIAPKPIFAAIRDSDVMLSGAASAQAIRDFDAQAQARRFISAQANLSSAIDPGSKARALSARGNSRIDAQEQARQFILAKPNFARIAGPAVLSVSKTKTAREASARSIQRAISSSE